MRSFCVFFLLCCVAGAQESCVLQTYASSWMASGTPFSIACTSGTYTGHLLTSPAKRFFRRGSLVLKFDAPVAAIGNTKRGEGKFQAGRGKQVTSMLLTGGSGIGAKDLLDGASGAIFKSWMMIPITFGAAALLEKGGDINLKPGYKIMVEGER